MIVPAARIASSMSLLRSVQGFQEPPQVEGASRSSRIAGAPGAGATQPGTRQPSRHRSGTSLSPERKLDVIGIVLVARRHPDPARPARRPRLRPHRRHHPPARPAHRLGSVLPARRPDPLWSVAHPAQDRAHSAALAGAHRWQPAALPLGADRDAQHRRRAGDGHGRRHGMARAEATSAASSSGSCGSAWARSAWSSLCWHGCSSLSPWSWT